MTSITERYSAAASKATGTVEKIADSWTQGAQTLSNRMLPGVPQINLVPVVERYFEFVQRTVDISRDLTIKWAETTGTLSGLVREQADKAGQEIARERYEGLTKAELSDLLGQRHLPKTGNVDELVQRLVEADSK